MLRFDPIGRMESAYVSPDGKTVSFRHIDLHGEYATRFVSLESGQDTEDVMDFDFWQESQIWIAVYREPKHYSSFWTVWTNWLLGMGSDQGRFDIYQRADWSRSRQIPGYRWCGFSAGDRGWTQNAWGEPEIILREWDVSFTKTPRTLIWLTIGTFAIIVWRVYGKSGRVNG